MKTTPPNERGQPSAASWPHAAAISRPRVSRTVHTTPQRSRWRTNSRSTGFGDASHCDPGVGVKRDDVDVHQLVEMLAEPFGKKVDPPWLVIDVVVHPWQQTYN